MTSFSPPNLQKMENKRHTIFCNEELSRDVKFEVNWIKNKKNYIRVQSRGTISFLESFVQAPAYEHEA